ncbi:MAG TPA: glycosyltransferase family A protein [Candidatus Polarisedimenticolaceae bacterium]|nr:glycosyltransferase family A protein [Candidatus Polarisedimenticolaceae bacterium]
MPAISVVIPTYNRAGLVVQAIESALGQTFADREIVVVDDGSTDGTTETLARFGSRIRVVRQENGGEARARNRGVREAAGTWVAFLDSDDLWEPEALERLAAAAEATPAAGLIAMKARAILADGTRTPRIHGKKSAGPEFTTRSLLWGDAGGVLMPMVRRDLLLAEGGFDESLRQATDCDMWLRLSFRTGMIAVPAPLLLCRVHPENASADRTVNAAMWLRILDKLARAQPGWVAANPWTYRRALGKERLRLGRERLAAWDGTREGLKLAREALRGSVAAFPFFARAWLYLLWSLVAPRGYAAWRRVEMRHR